MKQLIIPLIILVIFAVLITAQEGETEDPVLWLSVTGETCALAISDVGTHGMRPPETTPESTPETTPAGRCSRAQPRGGDFQLQSAAADPL